MEGEGCFILTNETTKKKGKVYHYNYPSVRAASTDLDVLTKVLEISGIGTISLMKKNEEHHKQAWQWAVRKKKDAIWLMEELRPYMGERRKSKIDEILQKGGQ